MYRPLILRNRACFERNLSWKINEPSDLAAFKEIVGGKIVDLSTLQRLAECDLVEDLNGTTVLTDTGVEVATKMSSAF